MTNSCPDCGSSMEYTSQPTRLLTGSCPGCGHSFTLLEGSVPPGRGAAFAEGDLTESEGTSERSTPSEGPPCSLCGASLTISATPGGLTAVCSGCSSSFQYVLRSDAELRPRRPARRDSYRDNDRGGYEAPRARPCRACGGPLQFSTSPEGLVTGTCASCGNTFTLPARRDAGGRGGRPGQRGGYSSRSRGGGGWGRSGDRGAPPPRFRSRGPPFRRRDSRRDDDEDDAPRSSRRRRDDE